MPVGKSVPERFPQRHVRDDRMDIVLFADGVGRDQQQDDADKRVDAEGRPPRGERFHARALERADDQGAHIAERAARHEEDEQRAKPEGNGRFFHHGNSSAVSVLALIRACRDERVGHRVDDVADGLDRADDREETEHEPPLRNEVGNSRNLGRLVKINEIVVEHGRKEAHRKLRQAQPYDQ